jgi:CRISPR-associated endonuclease/helicase Cas3
LIGLLKSMGPERWLLRTLQRFAVNVYVNDFAALERKGAIECVSGDAKAKGIYAVTNDVDYDSDLGLLVDDPPNNLDLFVL